jgi:acetyltransferase
MHAIPQIDRPPSEPVSIRDLTLSDAEACMAFCERLEPHDIRMRFAAIRSAPEYFLPEHALAGGGLAFTARDPAQAIVGVANLAYTNAVAAEIGLAVRSDRQRRGIGRALLAYAIRWAERDGLSQLDGYVLDENRPMLSLAQAMGFRQMRRSDVFIELRRPISCTPA